MSNSYKLLAFVILKSAILLLISANETIYKHTDTSDTILTVVPKFTSILVGGSANLSCEVRTFKGTETNYNKLISWYCFKPTHDPYLIVCDVALKEDYFDIGHYSLRKVSGRLCTLKWLNITANFTCKCVSGDKDELEDRGFVEVLIPVTETTTSVTAEMPVTPAHTDKVFVTDNTSLIANVRGLVVGILILVLLILLLAIFFFVHQNYLYRSVNRRMESTERLLGQLLHKDKEKGLCETSKTTPLPSPLENQALEKLSGTFKGISKGTSKNKVDKCIAESVRRVSSDEEWDEEHYSEVEYDCKETQKVKSKIETKSRNSNQYLDDEVKPCSSKTMSNPQVGVSGEGKRKLPAKPNNSLASAKETKNQADKIYGASLKCTALYDYSAKERNEVSFRKGDTINVNVQSGEWWKGTVERTGQSGFVPRNFLKEIAESMDDGELYDAR